MTGETPSLSCDTQSVATTPKKRPRDPLQLAKLIGDIATGQVEDKTEDNRDEAAVRVGRLGGLKGGVQLGRKA